MTITVIASAQTLAITDIITSDPNEPRIRDLRLAEALGMANPHAIRRIIARHLDTLESLGSMVSHPDAKPPTGGRPSCSYYLTKRQALFVTTKANTATAAMVTVQMVDLFDTVTSGRTPMAPPLPAGARLISIEVTDLERLTLAGIRAMAQEQARSLCSGLSQNINKAVTGVINTTLGHPIGGTKT